MGTMSIPLFSLLVLLLASGPWDFNPVPFEELVIPPLSLITSPVGASEFDSESECAARFYDLRQNSPAWVQEFRLTPEGAELLAMLRGSRLDGLDPGAYISDDLEEQLTRYFLPLSEARADRARDAARLDHSLTLSYLRYARHRAVGRVDRRSIEPRWPASAPPVDLVDRVASGSPRAVAESVEAGNPYARHLLCALRSYDRIARAGGWPRIPDGPDLSMGSTGTRVMLLRGRLGVPATGPEHGRFDARLAGAVRGFQERHGLAVTGKVDRSTLAALNVPVEERIGQISMNLERARWFPSGFGSRYILVNIAEAALRVVENDSVILRMRAVLGKVTRQTPMLADNVTSLVLNPAWNLPPVVIAEDVLSSPMGASAYLKAKHIRVLSSWGSDAREVDPDSIRWDQVTIEAMPYRFWMEPGGLNALGRVKFLFPNDEHIYIHDSPQRSLFRKDQRFFSSGCVRVERARDLATYLLRESSRWTEARVEAAVASGVETSIALRNPIPVYIVYLTAWVGEDGEVHFRPDLYGRDAQIAALMEGEHHAPAPASNYGVAEDRGITIPP